MAQNINSGVAILACNATWKNSFTCICNRQWARYLEKSYGGLRECPQFVNIWTIVASTQTRCFSTESRFWKADVNRSSRRKALKWGWDGQKLSPRSIAEVEGANVECNANLNFPGIQQRDTRMAADINLTQRDLKGSSGKRFFFFLG